ncbi:MAG: TIGR02450 family Trp-rich protein [Leptolyngbyaceae cyanobacterium HOT.MB2.61]|nr:TIGR02450 family Trp-rich protein [Leptolyngbyaceae cyanobacterium HOT.MB2.61]
MPQKQKFPHLVGSKWTACQPLEGWRHFQVVNRKNQGDWVFAELVAACDPSVRFWVNAKLLKERSLWQAGWQSFHEKDEEKSDDDAAIAKLGLNSGTSSNSPESSAISHRQTAYET